MMILRNYTVGTNIEKLNWNQNNGLVVIDRFMTDKSILNDEMIM